MNAAGQFLLETEEVTTLMRLLPSVDDIITHFHMVPMILATPPPIFDSRRPRCLYVVF